MSAHPTLLRVGASFFVAMACGRINYDITRRDGGSLDAGALDAAHDALAMEVRRDGAQADAVSWDARANSSDAGPCVPRAGCRYVNPSACDCGSLVCDDRHMIYITVRDVGLRMFLLSANGSMLVDSGTVAESIFSSDIDLVHVVADDRRDALYILADEPTAVIRSIPIARSTGMPIRTDRALPVGASLYPDSRLGLHRCGALYASLDGAGMNNFFTFDITGGAPSNPRSTWSGGLDGQFVVDEASRHLFLMSQAAGNYYPSVFTIAVDLTPTSDRIVRAGIDPSAHSVAGRDGILYAPSSTAGILAVYSYGGAPFMFNREADIPQSDGPHDIALHPTLPMTATSLRLTASVVYTELSLAPSRSQQVVSACSNPGPLTYTADGAFLVIACNSDRIVVHQIDPATGAVRSGAPVGSFVVPAIIGASGIATLPLI